MNEETKQTIFGAFLALYTGLDKEGAARVRNCLTGFVDDTACFPAERKFYEYALEEIAATHRHAEETCDEPPPRPQFKLIQGGRA
jgi:hypothetical protein